MIPPFTCNPEKLRHSELSIMRPRFEALFVNKFTVTRRTRRSIQSCTRIAVAPHAPLRRRSHDDDDNDDDNIT